MMQSGGALSALQQLLKGGPWGDQAAAAAAEASSSTGQVGSENVSSLLCRLACVHIVRLTDARMANSVRIANAVGVRRRRRREAAERGVGGQQ